MGNVSTSPQLRLLVLPDTTPMLTVGTQTKAVPFGAKIGGLGRQRVTDVVDAKVPLRNTSRPVRNELVVRVSVILSTEARKRPKPT